MPPPFRFPFFRPRIPIQIPILPRRTFSKSLPSHRTITPRAYGLEIIIDGAKRPKLPYIWLRDNCRCPHCVNPSTYQRAFNTFALPSSLKVRSVSETPTGLSVTWDHDGHVSEYTWDFLSFYLKNDARKPEDLDAVHWGAEIAEDPPTLEYDEVMQTQDGVGKMSALIRRYGLVFISKTPHSSPTPTESLLRRIAFIRETHYGAFYDFTPNLAMADTAYTNLPLAAHTDTTYFSDPAGLQSFHILSHTGGSGGESLLVDGFHAAKTLEIEDPWAAKILAEKRLPWHASGNAGITIAPDKRYPVLEMDDGELKRVRWNNDDRGVVPFDGGVEPEDWYKAARKWYKVLTRTDIEYWRLLKPGTTLVFDNWRVLHGRSTFTGVRRVCGGYINRDDFISRWRNTNYARSAILDRVLG